MIVLVDGDRTERAGLMSAARLIRSPVGCTGERVDSIPETRDDERVETADLSAGDLHVTFVSADDPAAYIPYLFRACREPVSLVSIPRHGSSLLERSQSLLQAATALGIRGAIVWPEQTCGTDRFADAGATNWNLALGALIEALARNAPSFEPEPAKFICPISQIERQAGGIAIVTGWIEAGTPRPGLPAVVVGIRPSIPVTIEKASRLRQPFDMPAAGDLARLYLRLPHSRTVLVEQVVASSNHFCDATEFPAVVALPSAHLGRPPEPKTLVLQGNVLGLHFLAEVKLLGYLAELGAVSILTARVNTDRIIPFCAGEQFAIDDGIALMGIGVMGPA